ncbi:DedA family protein [Oceanibium sediminis]|uniref:DedA family protein n=1 Tax=Oceanibium sediminis TaxID=2026339 RepID=UPI000DD3080B|nr:VTT domain-containing protein [Oceanibium sediminis]
MTDAAFSLVAHYGAWFLFVATFLSCLAVPLPASLLMLAAGGFASSGDMSLLSAAAAAWAGAVFGDQTGYAIGQRGSAVLLRRLGNPEGRRAAVLARARAEVTQRGGLGVFLSRWLFSPLGPYVNAIAGAVALDRGRFTLASMSGEAVWVLLYVGLGYLFTGQLAAVASVLSNATGFVTALAVTLILGLVLLRSRRRGRQRG